MITKKIQKEKNSEKKENLVVGVSAISPLVIKNNEHFSGFEIELWEIISKKLNISFKYVEYQFSELLEKLEKGYVSVGIGAITRTSRRKTVMNFSYLTLESSLMIVVSKSGSKLLKIAREFFTKNTKRLLTIFVILLGYFLLMTQIFWMVEKNSGIFSSTIYKEGIFDAFWLATATATTLGYGDIIPATNLGKIVAMITVSGGLFLFGFLSAQLASLIASSRELSSIHSVKDLVAKKVATKKGTIAHEELRKIGAKITLVDEIEEAYGILGQHKVEAVVFDAPVILHHVKESGNKDLLPIHTAFASQTYGFAFPLNSEIRESVNRAILEIHESGEYDLLYSRWFGERLV